MKGIVKNCMTRSFAMTHHTKISLGRKKIKVPLDYPTLDDVISEVEAKHIKATLDLTGWNL